MNGKGTTYQSAMHCASNYAPVPALADYSFTSDENADAPTLDTDKIAKRSHLYTTNSHCKSNSHL